MAKAKRSPVSFLVGLVVFALVIVGAFNVLSFVINKAGDVINDTEKLSEYEEFIAPIIMNDPDTFDDVSVANQSQLISITIWSILESDLATDQYEYADTGMLMPIKDVEKHFVELFGDQVKLVHTTVDGGDGIAFEYSEKQKCYIIPITGITPIYTPRIEDAQKREGSVVLTVAYLASTDWQQNEKGEMVEPEANKHVKITLGISGDEYYIRAIQSLGATEITTTSEQQNKNDEQLKNK